MIKHIVVTKEHIEKGTHDSEFCPVAMAIKEVCPNSQPHVYGADIYFEQGDDDGIGIKAPESVADFVFRFDGRLTSIYNPFEFDIDIPDWVCND